MVTKTSKSVKEYFEKMQQEVILNWKNLDNADSIAESEFLTYYEIGKAKSWLENISYLGNSKDSLPWEEFESRLPENLSNSEKRKQLFAEFNYLFPQSKRTEAFFPLLLTSFSLNSSRNKPFVRDLFTTKLPIDIETSVNELTSIPKWEKTYERLIKNKKARKVSIKNLARALAVYRRIMVFFLFIKASSEITNIPLSFYAFEAMSGYISLLDNEAQEMIDNLDSGGMRGLLEPDESMTIKIRNYVNETFDQFCEMKLDFKVEEDVYDIYYGEHFLRFLGNLRRCLYLSCRERDTKPLLEDDADFFALLDTKHSSGDELTQLMKDNHATEPLFFFFDELSFRENSD